jgi:prevent-host-death family protein
MMSATELKAGLSEALSRVEAGEEILVTQHGRPVARLMPLPPVTLDAATEKLVRAGILLPPPLGPVPDSFFDLPRDPDPEGLLLKALLADREEEY